MKRTILKSISSLFALCVALFSCAKTQGGEVGRNPNGSGFNYVLNLTVDADCDFDPEGAEAELLSLDGTSKGKAAFEGGQAKFNAEDGEYTVKLYGVGEAYDYRSIMFTENEKTAEINIGNAKQDGNGVYLHTLTIFLGGFGAEEYGIMVCSNLMCRIYDKPITSQTVFFENLEFCDYNVELTKRIYRDEENWYDEQISSKNITFNEENRCVVL